MGEILGESAVRALGEDGHWREEVVARLVIAARRAVVTEALVARADSRDLAALAVKDLDAARLRQDRHAELLGALGEPGCELLDRKRHVAVVAVDRRNEEARDREGARLQEVVEGVPRDGRSAREALLAIVGYQLGEDSRVEDRARHAVKAALRRLLHHADLHLVPCVPGTPCELDARGEAGGATAHDEDVKGDRLAFHATDHRMAEGQSRDSGYSRPSPARSPAAAGSEASASPSAVRAS